MNLQPRKAHEKKPMASREKKAAASALACREPHDVDTLRHHVNVSRLHMELMVDKKKRIQRLHQTLREKQTCMSDECSIMDGNIRRKAEEVKAKREGLLQKKLELERLQKETTELAEKKQQALHDLQRYSSDIDLMDQVAKVLGMKDAEAVIDYLRGLSVSAAKLHGRAAELERMVDEQEGELERQKHRRKMEIAQKHNELSRRQKECDGAWSEARAWERKLREINDTESEKTLRLGQIRLATLNMYEMICDAVKEDLGVDVENTEGQLEVLGFYCKHSSQAETQTVDGNKNPGSGETEG